MDTWTYYCTVKLALGPRKHWPLADGRRGAAAGACGNAPIQL